MSDELLVGDEFEEVNEETLGAVCVHSPEDQRDCNLSKTFRMSEVDSS